MIKLSLKNFFSNLKYVFVILGVVFIGVLFGVNAVINSITRQIKILTEDINNLSSEISVSSEEVKSVFIDAYSSVDWTDFDNVANNVFTEEFWSEKIVDRLKDQIPKIESSIEKIAQDVSNAIEDILTNVFKIIIYSVIGLIIGYIITYYYINKDMVKGNIFKFILRVILDTIVTIGLIILASYLIGLWNDGAILIIIGAFMLYFVLSFIDAFLLYGKGKIKFKECLNFKNMLGLMLANLINIALFVGICLVVVYLTNILVSVFIGVAFMLVVFISNSLNAESYIKALAVKKQSVKEIQAKC